MSNLYIHYGADKFDKLKVLNIKGLEDRKDKPCRGIWASPVGADWGWYDWCKSERFHEDSLTNYFYLELNNNARILHVYEEDDIIPYIEFDNSIEKYRSACMTRTCLGDRIRFEDLYKEYDGMELHMSDNYVVLHYSIFCTWDVDSIVIWNPDVIVPVNKSIGDREKLKRSMNLMKG